MSPCMVSDTWTAGFCEETFDNNDHKIITYISQLQRKLGVYVTGKNWLQVIFFYPGYFFYLVVFYTTKVNK